MQSPLRPRGPMKSGVYIGPISHVRYTHRNYRFRSTHPWWLLDLDEISLLEKSFWGFKRGNFSLFSFRDHDHISLGSSDIKENITLYLRQQGVQEEIVSIQLLTNLRSLGYVFNPVSFYFVQGHEHRWVIAEVGNTFWEQKPTLLGPFKGDKIEQKIDKFFYVSPFLSLDNKMILKVSWPSEKLQIIIDDYNLEGVKELSAVYAGQRQEISQGLIFKLSLRFPLMSLFIIAAIHLHAFRLWWLKIPYIKKSDNSHLQQGVYQWKSRKFVKQS